MATNTRTDLEERVDRALDAIRPMLAADGGDVWLVRVEPPTAYVQMVGACGGCSVAHLTLKNGIERAVLDAVCEIASVIAL